MNYDCCCSKNLVRVLTVPKATMPKNFIKIHPQTLELHTHIEKEREKQAERERERERP